MNKTHAIRQEAQMLTELGYRDEFNRLAEKFIREKTA